MQYCVELTGLNIKGQVEQWKKNHHKILYYETHINQPII